MSLITHLQQTSIKNLIDPTRVLVTANGQDKVWNTLALLGKNKLLSCPVLNETENKYAGFVDIIDIMTALVAAGLSLEVVEILTDSPPSLEDFIAVASNALADTNTLEILSELFFHKDPQIETNNIKNQMPQGEIHGKLFPTQFQYLM